MQLDKLHSWLLFSLLFTAHVHGLIQARNKPTLCYSHFLHHIFHFLGTTWHVYLHIIYKRSTFLLFSRMMYMDGQWNEYKQHSEGQRLLRSRGWVVFLSRCCAERRQRAVRQQLWCCRSRWLHSPWSAMAVFQNLSCNPVFTFHLCSVCSQHFFSLLDLTSAVEIFTLIEK